MQAKPYMVRQGDVLLVEARDGVPAASEVVEHRGSVVLAHGEATGHTHRVDATTATLYRAPDGEDYLEVRAQTVLLHEEHRAVPIPPGTYRVIRQREYDPAPAVDQRFRQVLD